MSLWSTARYDLRLTDEQFWELTPRQFDALRKRHERRIEHMELQTGIVASATVNTSMCRPEKAVKPADFMCSQQKLPQPGKKRITKAERQHVAASVRGLFGGFMALQQKQGIR